MNARRNVEWNQFLADYQQNCRNNGVKPTRSVAELFAMFNADFPEWYGARGVEKVYCGMCKSPFLPSEITDGKCADCHAITENLVALGHINTPRRKAA